MPDLTVAVAQSIAVPGNLGQSVQDHVRLASDAAERGARLVLFPELSLTGYDRGLTRAEAIGVSDAMVRPLQAIADARGITIIAGAPVESPSGLYIAALCFVPGRGVVVHTKRYLHEGEEVAFVPGPGGEPLFIDGQVVCIAICADITHPEHARDAAGRGADIYAASCFITPGGYDADTSLLMSYAREHDMAVLMANYGGRTSEWMSGGRSGVWSRAGEPIAIGPDAGEAVVVTTLPSRGGNRATYGQGESRTAVHS